MLRAEGEEGESRIENIKELKTSILSYINTAENDGDEPTLSGFLEEISLYTDQDRADESQDAMTLMTIHAAKGLEFENVFLIGLEEGVFPGRRSMDSPEEIARAFAESGRSRLPVYEDSIDNIIGVLYLNHFLKAMTDDGRADIRKLLMPPCYVYKTMKLPAVLSQLRKVRQHLAIVADEYGGMLGVLTMEDVLEQIVGDIWDETDTVEEEVVQRPSGEYELDGDMVLGDMLELFDISEDDFEAESDTVGGWTLERFGTFPRAGDSFCYEGLSVTVLAMDGHRVEKVLVKRDGDETEKTEQ